MDYNDNKGFTMVELMVVTAIITIGSVVGLMSYRGAYERSQVNEAGQRLQEIRGAVEAFNADLGFFPPDRPAGDDPGLVSAVTCSGAGCPAGWNTTAALPAPAGRWRGPYLSAWPAETPWKGQYDYEYYKNPTSVPPCPAYPPGVYIKITAPIPERAERLMIQQGIDICTADINGEVRMLIKRL